MCEGREGSIQSVHHVCKYACVCTHMGGYSKHTPSRMEAGALTHRLAPGCSHWCPSPAQDPPCSLPPPPRGDWAPRGAITVSPASLAGSKPRQCGDPDSERVQRGTSGWPGVTPARLPASGPRLAEPFISIYCTLRVCPAPGQVPVGKRGVGVQDAVAQLWPWAAPSSSPLSPTTGHQLQSGCPQGRVGQGRAGVGLKPCSPSSPRSAARSAKRCGRGAVLRVWARPKVPACWHPWSLRVEGNPQRGQLGLQSAGLPGLGRHLVATPAREPPHKHPSIVLGAPRAGSEGSSLTQRPGKPYREAGAMLL